MIRDKDIDAGNVVLDTGATPVLNCVHDAVDHNLGTEWVVAGHGNHTDRDSFAAGSNALGIGAAALGAGTVMGHIDFKGVKRFAIGWTADILLEINPGRSSQNQFGVIAGGVDMDANATLRMHPFPVAALIVTGENKNMVCTSPPAYTTRTSTKLWTSPNVPAIMITALILAMARLATVMP